MEHDYYSILGVSPTAAVDVIKKAFRRKALECHPDRGGSHAEMVLVIQAWEVLSNPELRSRYDAARNHSGDAAAQQAAAADAQAAEQRAEQYPPRWADMDVWLNRVAQDFAGAQFDSVQLSHPLFGCVAFPTAGRSVSGWGFILIGAALGWVILSPLSLSFIEKPLPKQSAEKPLRGRQPGDGRPRTLAHLLQGMDPNERSNLGLHLALLIAPVLGGALIGQGIHMCIGGVIEKRRATRQAQRQPEGETKSSQTVPPPSTPLESRVFACERCGQKLRVPAMKAELLVTCGACGHKFDALPHEAVMPTWR